MNGAIRQNGDFADPHGNGNLPLYLIILPWTIMLCIYCWGPIMYRPLSLRTWVYLSMALVALVSGYKLAWQATKIVEHEQWIIREPVYKVMCLIALCGSAGLLFDYIRSGFSLAVTFTDPVANRDLSFDRNTTWLTTACFPWACFSYSCILITLMRLKRGRRDGWSYVAVVAITLCVLGNMAQSGRQAMFVSVALALAYCTTEYVKQRRFFRRHVLTARNIMAIAVGLTVVVLYCVFIGARRHHGTLSYDAYAAQFGVSKSAVMETLVDGVGEQWSVGIVAGLRYYSHQLSALDTLINAWPTADGLGRHVLGWPLLELKRTGLDLTADTTQISATLEKGGEYMWGWETGLSRPLNDFGVPGSLLFCCVVAYGLGAAFKRTAFGQSEAMQLVAIWMLEQCIFGIQFFPTDGIHFLNFAFSVAAISRLPWFCEMVGRQPNLSIPSRLAVPGG